jgi:hypothetical protein
MSEDWLVNWKSNINTSYVYLVIAHVLNYFFSVTYETSVTVQNT